MAQAQNDVHADRSRLLAKLVRDILATPDADEFEELADVIESLKCRCARLHIGWTNDAITDALRMVASNVALPAARVLEARRRRMADRERAIENRAISRAEAAAILKRLGVRL